MEKKKVLTMLIGILTFIMLVGGTAYAYFIYNKKIADVSIDTGNISINFQNANNMNVSNMIPLSNSLGKVNGNHIDFTITGTVDTERIYYEVYLVPSNTTTMTAANINSYIKTYLTNQNDVKINDVRLYGSLTDSKKNNGKVIYQDIIVPNTDGSVKNINENFRLRLWINDKYTNLASENFDFSVYLYAFNVDDNYSLPSDSADLIKNTIQEKIDNNVCTPKIVDDNDTLDESDDITYLSGTNECIDFNYVWYSGKLWRIVAIYPDKTMKLVTESPITALNWGSDSEFDGSWIYQWLNEDFYDTLVNPEDILVEDGVWNYSLDASKPPLRPESVTPQKTVRVPVGLLNAYEYYNAYRNSSTNNNYLKNDYSFWLITASSPDSGKSRVKYVAYNGNLSNHPTVGNRNSVRPAIYLNSGVKISGDGTKSNPYKILGDIESPVNNTTLISNRVSGEYVNFNNEIYRIASIDKNSGITKLIKADYIVSDGAVVTKKLASTNIFGKNTNTQSNDYWDYYLNNTWYSSISNTYKNMLVNDTFYLGNYDERHYKNTICKGTEAELNNVTTKNCSKYTSSDTDKIFVGKVGISRVGEMFSSQLKSPLSLLSNIWTLSPKSGDEIYNYGINTYSFLNFYSPAGSNLFGVRPIINLKYGIKITGGTGYVGGDVNSPFTISE